MTLINYNIKNLMNEALNAYYNKIENKDDTLLKSLNINFKHMNYKNNTYTIIKYNRETLKEELFNTQGLFRSIILNEQNTIVGFSPPKSLSLNYFMELHANNQDKCRAEEFVDGTMINVFYTNNEWQIATKSKIGGDYIFFNNNLDKNKNCTFRTMFFETCKDLMFDLNVLNKEFCYSFVLHHENNRIVTPILNRKLYLIKIYKITDYIINEIDTRKYVEEMSLQSKISLPTLYNFTSFKELSDTYASPSTDFKIVGVMIYSPNGDRTKFRNPNYETIRLLRGNQPKLQYHYLNLRKHNTINHYLMFFPEHKEIFNKFKENLYTFTDNTYKNYISCYIKKEKPLRDYPQQYRTTMYNLHQYYLNVLKNKKLFISKQIVIFYINNLHASQQMSLLNYNPDKYKNITTE